MTTQRIAAQNLVTSGYFSVGDEVLYGKWKNLRGKILRFFDDERGVPSVEIEPTPKGRKTNKTLGLYKIWKPSAERKKQACVIFSKKCDGDIVLGKVRDRMYDPAICIYHLEVDGTEMCVMFDRITGFCEGINEHGIGIVNSSLMVLQDEREGVAEGENTPERSPDGVKIIKALTKHTLPEVLRSLISYKPSKFQRGLKGHVLVSDGTQVYALENTRIHTPKVLKLPPDEVHTRTNHGIYYPGAGYTKGEDYISSVVRQWEAKKQLEKVQRAEDLMPSLTQSIEKTDGSLNPVRFTDKMRTTSQMVVNPAKGEMLLYLVPEHSKFKGVRNLLPNGRRPKMKVRVFKYPSKERLKDPYVTVPDELDSISAKKSLQRQVMAQRVLARYKSKKVVTTKDGEDMTVYEYSDRQIANRNREKAERIEKLRKSMKKLRSQFERDLKAKDEKKRAVALAVALMDHLFERVGNEGSAKDGHFGVTTWQVKHVKFNGKKAVLKYVGKSGVDQKKEVTDVKILSALKAACEGKKDSDDVIDAGAEDVNAYLEPFNISAKDIRGFHANTEMKAQLKKIRAKSGKIPEDKKEREKKLKEEFKKALELTAECVGHTPSILRSSYLVPGLEADYLKDGTINEKHTKSSSMLRVAAEQGTPTERRILANALNAPVLVIRPRTWWIKQAPALYRMARDLVRARPLIEGIRFPHDLFAMLWYENEHGERLNPPSDMEIPPGAHTQHAQFPTVLHHSILLLNDDGTSTSLGKGESSYPSDLVTAMVRSGDWDVADAIMVAGQSCERCLNVLFHHYGSDDGYPFGSDEYWRCRTRCEMCEQHVGDPREELSKRGTKSEAEREDDQVQKMLRPEPKKKPPRYDLRNNRTLDEEDEENLGGGDDGDRDLSMKWNKVGRRVVFRWLAVPTEPSSVRLAFQYQAQQTTAPVKPPAAGAKQEAPTFEEWVKEKRWPSKAENAPPGAEIGFRGLEKQDPAAATKVREEFKRQFPKAEEDEGEKEKGKKEEEPPKARSREDIDADLESARMDMDEIKDSVEELESKVKEQTRKIEELRQKSRSPKLDKSKIKDRIEEEKKKMRKTVEQMRPLGKTVDDLDDKIGEIKKQIKEQQVAIKGYKEFIDATSANHPQVAEFKEKISEVRQKIREMEGELEDSNEEHKEKKGEYTRLRQEGRQSAKAVEFLEGKLQQPDSSEKDDPAEKVKAERKKLNEVQDELDEKKEDLKAKQQQVHELKEERKDPTGQKRQQEKVDQQQKQVKKNKKKKRTAEALEQTKRSMEAILGEGSSLPKHVKAEIETQLDALSDDDVEKFALKFQNTLKNLIQGNPTSDDSISTANALAKSGFSTQGLKDPDDLGEHLAKVAYTRNVVANPMIVGGSPVGQLSMSNEEYSQRGMDAFRHFEKLNGILRKDANTRIQAALRDLDPETNKAKEIQAIQGGLNLAHIADTGEALKGMPQPSKGSAALIRRSVETGNVAMLLGTSEDLFTEESLQAMRQSLDAMKDEELADFLLGDDPKHPFAPLRKILETPDVTGGEYKQLIKSFLVDDWMQEVWGDRAVRDVMKSTGNSAWDDPQARANILEAVKKKGGPRQQESFESIARIEDARKRGEQPDPKDMQVVQDVLGEGGEGLRERATGLMDTLKSTFNKAVITPAIAVYKNFIETGDSSVMRTETVPHADENVPEPRTQEERAKEQAKRKAPKPLKNLRVLEQSRLKKYREKLEAQRDKLPEKVRPKIDKKIQQVDKALAQYAEADLAEPEKAEEPKRAPRKLKKKHEATRDFTDEELDNEAGEYFENVFTQAALPGAFKDADDLKRRVKEAEVTHLDADQLAEIANSDVGDILRAEDPSARARELAEEYGRDLGRVERGIAEGAEMPPALVLKDKNGKLVLMGGNTRLMGGAAAGTSMPVKVVEVDSEFDEEAGAAAAQEADDEEHGPGDVWKTEAGNWRAKNRRGAPKTFDDKAKATQYAKGKEREEGDDPWSLGRAPKDADKPWSLGSLLESEEGDREFRFATDKMAEIWLSRIRSIHPDDPNRPFIEIAAA